MTDDFSHNRIVSCLERFATKSWLVGKRAVRNRPGAAELREKPRLRAAHTVPVPAKKKQAHTEDESGLIDQKKRNCILPLRREIIDKKRSVVQTEKDPSMHAEGTLQFVVAPAYQD